MDDTLKKLGKVQPEDQGRDAIHIAVLTVQAKTAFLVNQTNTPVAADGSIVPHGSPHAVGIMDPFIPPLTLIKPGEWFYVYLKPGTITGLQHVWTHPAFPRKDLPQLIQVPEDMTAAAEQRVKQWCQEAGIMPDDFIEALRTGRADRMDIEGSYLVTKGWETNAYEIPDSIINDVELATGKRVKYRPTQFSCSC